MASQGVPQFGSPFVDGNGNITQVWYQFLVNLSGIAGGQGFAPATGSYVVSASSPSLPNADVAQNSTTITWDFTTANQAKLHVTLSSIVIPESQVTNLVTDLANRALKSTDIIAGTGLSGGGTLASNVTLNVGTNGITNALLAQMPSHTIKGNNGGSVADPSDLTISQLTALFGGASGTVSLAALTPIGTQGSLTVSNGLITAIVNPT